MAIIVEMEINIDIEKFLNKAAEQVPERLYRQIAEFILDDSDCFVSGLRTEEIKKLAKIFADEAKKFS